MGCGTYIYKICSHLACTHKLNPNIEMKNTIYNALLTNFYANTDNLEMKRCKMITDVDEKYLCPSVSLICAHLWDIQVIFCI